MGSHTFNYTGDWQKWNVPTGVKLVDISVRGAGSGTKNGGLVTGRLKVGTTDQLLILVGEAGNAASGRNGGARAVGGGGAGGTGSTGKNGGRGGGGASYIRRNRRDGKIIAVAGGAGGNSGDGGDGGQGGGSVGEHGYPAAGSGTTHNSTGGTQNQPGKGGTSSAAEQFWGGDGTGGMLGRGGAGATAGDGKNAGSGGGGGGGGYFPGGGGQCETVGHAPGGGGAGGSNYYDPLFNTTSVQGGGTTGNGQVVLTWEDPGGNDPPVPPQNITINGQTIADELATKATNSVMLRGTPDDPNSAQDVRIMVYVSRTSDFANYSRKKGTYDATEHRDKVQIDGLVPNTLYYLRIYTQDSNGKLSLNYTATSFWTDRRPSPPELLSPGDNTMFSADLNVTFTWNHSDPDPADPQDAWELRYRRAATPIDPAGEWHSTDKHLNDSTEMWVIDAGTFKTNVFYEWTVRTADGQGQWGEWATPASFYIQGESTPPVLVEPLSVHTALVASQVNRFMWKFQAPNSGEVQHHADLRYRTTTGDGTWTTLAGDTSIPGDHWFWDVPGDTFAPGYRYEWQARTYSSDLTASDWSDSGYFIAVITPGSKANLEIVESGKALAPLGIGNNEAFIYDRGGEVMRGQLKPMEAITWSRSRDDMTSCIIRISNWTEEQVEFYRSIHTWMHEVVVFRDGVRAWEGPITRITSRRGYLEIEAKDVTAYVYRRIMRQGYNDAYRVINGTEIGLHTVVERAQQIIMDALSYDDPNVLGYLTALTTGFDARTSRFRADYALTAWEELDDLAQNAGLDYGAVGRRIMLWDTHTPIGRLPEMRNESFSDNDPIITEYGMSAANYSAVTDGNGIWGDAMPVGFDPTDPGPMGILEILNSSYGEATAPESGQTLDQEGRRKLIAAMSEQAKRNVSGRWPVPLIVRVPDNSTLNPNLNLGINQLVPGVWIPLRADTGLRSVSQWQKLDSMTVTQDKSGEKIAVTMSPAPNGGADPDAESSDATEAGA